MYPDRELTELTERKQLLQARIALRRWECAAAAAELARPVAGIDRAVGAWRRVSPFVKFLGVPAGFLLTRFISGKRKSPMASKGKLGLLLTALPLIVRGAKVVMAVRAARSAPKRGARSDVATTAKFFE